MELSKEYQLWQACTEGDLELVLNLSKDPTVNVNWVGPDKNDAPIHRSCRFNHLEILLGNPRVDVRQENVFGGTPMTISCFTGDTEMVSILLRDLRVDPNKPASEGATPLYFAAQEGHTAVAALLLSDPRVDPGQSTNEGSNPLFMSSQEGHLDVVKLLLSDLRVDPNQGKDSGATPFNIACENGHLDEVTWMLDDPRIDPNRTDNEFCTPLWFASQNGHLAVVQHLLASDWVIDTKSVSTFNNTTAAQHGRKMKWLPKLPNDSEEVHRRKSVFGPIVADLVDEYEKDPVGVRTRLRGLPGGVQHFFIGHLFAIVVFFTDGFLLPKNTVPATTPSPIERFLRISSRLPLELQMVLCNRTFCSPRNVVRSREAEPGFKWLARPTTWLRFQQ